MKNDDVTIDNVTISKKELAKILSTLVKAGSRINDHAELAEKFEGLDNVKIDNSAFDTFLEVMKDILTASNILKNYFEEEELEDIIDGFTSGDYSDQSFH